MLCMRAQLGREKHVPWPHNEMVMYAMNDLQYQTVYNTLSFSLASMMATTMYLWLRSTAVHDKFKSAVLISGLVAFIAAHLYLLLIEILLVMELDGATYSSKSKSLGAAAALMIVAGYWFISMVFFLYIVQELVGGPCGGHES